MEEDFGDVFGFLEEYFHLWSSEGEEDRICPVCNQVHEEHSDLARHITFRHPRHLLKYSTDVEAMLNNPIGFFATAWGETDKCLICWNYVYMGKGSHVEKDHADYIKSMAQRLREIGEEG